MIKFLLSAYLVCLPCSSGCTADRIKDRPISFSAWRAQETINYINSRYDRNIDSLEMLPVMVVVHFTAMDSLEVSFNYMNNEHMESGRGILKNAGKANIAVQFLVDKNGDIYRLMPENHIGRHVIGMNRHAIGIENVGANEAALTKAQIDANEYIVRHLKKKYPIRYLIAHSEYRTYEQTPLWEERDPAYRTPKVDPGESFMRPLRHALADLQLKSVYDGGEIPDRLDFLLQDYQRRNLFNGNVLVIEHGKEIFRKSYGKAGGDGAPALTGTEMLYLASAAKPITASAIAILAEQNKLKLDDPVKRFFPELRHLLGGVTIRHLLSHTSGLADYYRNGRPKAGFTNKDAIAIVKLQNKPLSLPGSKFHYSNANYVLLAEIIEALSGRKFEDFIRENMLNKIPMRATAFGSTAANQDLLTPALDAEGHIYRYDYATVGPGGLYTVIDDLLRFDAALWGHELFSAKTLAVFTTPLASVKGRAARYALGWYVDLKAGTMYHDGNFSGYHTMNWLAPAEKSAIIIMANRHTTKVREITYEISRVLRGQKARPL
jgi:CubicO group peptidase (beta-lactamase class C family)